MMQVMLRAMATGAMARVVTIIVVCLVAVLQFMCIHSSCSCVDE
jgi:hypothetical protein